MQVHPWLIASWPILEREIGRTEEIVSGLTHLGTTVAAECDDFGRLLGHTIWGGGDSGVGVAWDWVEAIEGVFALSDPMGVVSNVGYVDERGRPVADMVSAVQLNCITYSLPWQAEVAKATSMLRVAGSRSDGERPPSRPGARDKSGAPRMRNVLEDSAFRLSSAPGVAAETFSEERSRQSNNSRPPPRAPFVVA